MAEVVNYHKIAGDVYKAAKSFNRAIQLAQKAGIIVNFDGLDIPMDREDFIPEEHIFMSVYL